MSLDRGQLNRMSLGATQALPAPTPAIASIQWASDDNPRSPDSLVEIVFEKTPSHAIIWTVRLGDVKAIEAKTSIDAEKKDITWFVGSRVATALDGKDPVQGIAYVLEEAQTLLRLEHGLSVIDSVQVAAGLLPIPSRETDARLQGSL